MALHETRTSMVIAGRGARACDMCGKDRSRWYCAADEAYLCERCDESVHSANAVAKRHERVRLGPNGAPLKLKPSNHSNQKFKTKGFSLSASDATASQPGDVDLHKWGSSSRKRTRTTCRAAKTSGHSFLISAVPEEPLDHSSSLTQEERNDTGLLVDGLPSFDEPLTSHQTRTALNTAKAETFSPSSTLTSRICREAEFTHEVPTYEPLLQDLIDSSQDDLMENILPSCPSLCNASCGSRSSTSAIADMKTVSTEGIAVKQEKLPVERDGEFQTFDLADGNAGDIIEGLPSNDDSDIDTFDVMDLCSNATFDDSVKDEELHEDFPNTGVYETPGKYVEGACPSIFDGNPFKGKGERDLDLYGTDTYEDPKSLQQNAQEPSLHRPLSLHLDYEEVINAWSDRGSLWMDGQRPQIVPDISILNHGFVDHGMLMMAESNCSTTMCSQAGQVPSLVVVDKGREARVLRYKEKRRTRLFSKRIRYEVRKLNAERRPRMKGRFVKRAAIAAMVAM